MRIPDISWAPPLCPICDRELVGDLGWECEHCGIAWDQDGRNPAFVDEAAPVCGHTTKILGERYTCVLRLGADNTHPGSHAGPPDGRDGIWSCWDEDGSPL
jgi:hypothetical protein